MLRNKKPPVRMLRKVESNFYSERIEEIKGTHPSIIFLANELTVQQKIQRNRPQVINKPKIKATKGRSLTPKFFKLTEKKMKNAFMRNSLNPGSLVKKRLPRATKQISNPLSKRLGERRTTLSSQKEIGTDKGGKRSVSTNAWCDVRFQNFYMFSNKNRNQDNPSDELFISSDCNVYNAVVENRSGKGQEFDCSSLNLTSATKRQVKKNRKIETRKFYLRFTNDFYKELRVVCLIRGSKIVFLRGLEHLKPIAVIDFDIINPDLIASREMKKQLRVNLVINEARYQIVLQLFSNEDYQSFLNEVRRKKAKHKKVLRIDFGNDKNFFKKFYISEDEFLKTVNTGDLLLFK